MITRIFFYSMVVFPWVVDAARAQSLSDQLKREPVESLVADVRQHGDAVQGAVLFARKGLGCANCHARGSKEMVGPDLSRVARESGEHDVIESLLYPSKKIREGYEATLIETTDGETLSLRVIEQLDDALLGREVTPPYRLRKLDRESIVEVQTSPVSSMPDSLSDQLQSRQEFLDLVRYLIEMREAGPALSTPGGGERSGSRELRPELAGWVLWDQHQCRACHDVPQQDLDFDLAVTPSQAPRLNEVGRRLDPDYLMRLIMDPSATKPGTRMPQVLEGLPAEEREEAAEAIAHFLISLDQESFSRVQQEGQRAKRGEVLFHEVGCVACHAPRDADGKEVDLADSVPLGRLEQKYSIESLTQFLEDPLQVRSTGRMPDMQLDHFEAQELAHYLAGSKSEVAASEFVVDADKAAEGRKLFGALGCANCHDSVGVLPHKKNVVRSLEAGCLSGESGSWPQYAIDQEQRDVLAEFITAGPLDLDASDKVELAMASLRCYACHQRDGLGGVSLERDALFQTLDFNLGPQGRLPPNLTGVGDKLKAQWLRQVLVSGRSIRPYMKTRMPQYGADNLEELMVHLVAADDQPPSDHAEPQDRRESRKIGQQLVGNQGLNCIACHTYQLNPSETMSAVDLTDMHERLQRDWFEAYMREPQRLSPNTVMPSFWPGGKSIRPEVLGGDAQQQIDALWTYLEEGRQAGVPRGLRREPIELLATDEAVMLRRSYPGVGKRGIGIGYAAGVNAVFDAEQLRLATLWKGKFADPSGVWRSQGHGQVRPLGQNVLSFPAGPELYDPAEPWDPEFGRPRGYQFQGYRLDEQRRPMFRYSFQGVQVTDDLREIRLEGGDVGLKRVLTFERKSGNRPLVFRVGRAAEVEQIAEDTLEISGGLKVQLKTDEAWSFHEVGDEVEVRVPLDPAKTDSRIEVIYTW
jgi:putative heme-binding domain-containing protein